MDEGEFTQKIDVLDFLIATLKEHEKKLSDLIDKSEETLERMEKVLKEIEKK